MDSFKPIPKYPDYEINTDGDIRRIGSDHCLSQFSVNGHMKVKLHGKNEYVGRLVAMTFIPNPENHKYIIHENKNRYDDQVDNLRWVSKSESQRKSFDRGIDVPGYKQSAKKVIALESNKIFDSVKSCARFYKVSPSCIRYCIKNKKKCKGESLRFL